jgi:DNA-binding NtrC family response regulator
VQTAKQVTTNSLRDKSILIVDDDASMLRALEKVLGGEGAIVTSIPRGDDAIELLALRREGFDLLITDLRIPFVTGATLVYAVHQVFPTLPIIVLTAFGDPAVKTACLEQGAAAFLEKPLDTIQLLSAIFGALTPPGGRSENAGRRPLVTMGAVR